MVSDKTEDDVLELLESLDKGGEKSNSTVSTVHKPAGENNKEDDDILGFLDSLTEDSSKKIPTPSNDNNQKPDVQELNEQVKTPHEDLETPDSSNTNSTQQETNDANSFPDPILSLSSWWQKNKVGLWDTASNAVKQAEAKVREFQPEVVQTQKQAIDSLNDSISKFKLNGNILQSTISSVLDSIAPPISRHEQLQIHVFHDMVGYSSVDNIIYSVFERVMQQVEGGGYLTMTVQKGKEKKQGPANSSTEYRELNIFKGPLNHAQKLAAASVDEFIRSEKKVSTKPIEGSEHTNEEGLTSSVDEDGRVSYSKGKTDAEPIVRLSNIYLSIQASSTEVPNDSNKSKEDSEQSPLFISSSSSRTFQFVIYLKDPDHEIELYTVSQSFPLQWAEWLDSADGELDITTIDPREWVIDWVEEGLGLSVGVLAQTYVSRRMGISDLQTSKSSN